MLERLFSALKGRELLGSKVNPKGANQSADRKGRLDRRLRAQAAVEAPHIFIF